MTSVVRTRGLTKRYGPIEAVSDLDLDVHERDLFGFLGPNGAGKTTTIRMLMGLVFATSGRIQLLGEEIPRHWRRVLPHVGALVEGPAFYPHASGRANLELLDSAAPAGGRSDRHLRIDSVLERVGLVHAGGRRVKTYSSGMRQRLGLAAALLRPHWLLFLDEPTNGLDPQGAREIRHLLTALVEDGTTVLLSSHLLRDVESICTRAGIIHRGRLVAQGKVSELTAPTGRVCVNTPDIHTALTAVSELQGTSVIASDGESVFLELGGIPPGELNRRLVMASVSVRELVIERRTLEDVFLDLTTGDGTRPNPVVPVSGERTDVRR